MGRTQRGKQILLHRSVRYAGSDAARKLTALALWIAGADEARVIDLRGTRLAGEPPRTAAIRFVAVGTDGALRNWNHTEASIRILEEERLTRLFQGRGDAGAYPLLADRVFRAVANGVCRAVALPGEPLLRIEFLEPPLAEAHDVHDGLAGACIVWRFEIKLSGTNAGQSILTSDAAVAGLAEPAPLGAGRGNVQGVAK